MRPLHTVIALAFLQSAFLSPLHAAKTSGGKSGSTKASLAPSRAPKVPASVEREFDFFNFGFGLSRAFLGLGGGGGSSMRSSGSKSSHYEREIERPAPYRALAGKSRAAIDKLFSQEVRPTIAQVMKVVRSAHGGQLPKENPFGDASRAAESAEAIADTIAQLERAYPGATLYPVGRDAALIGDALHAFYSSIGQADRVRPLDISHPSFPNYHGAVTEKTAEQDRPLLNSFLKTNGIDVEKLKPGTMHVMIDATPYAKASQSRQLMRAAFQTAAMKGIAPGKVYEHVAFVGLPGGGRFRLSDSMAKVEAGKKALQVSSSKDGPEDIFYLDTDINRLSYTGFWHEMFETLLPDGKGGVVAMRGAPTRTAEREHAAAQLYEVGRIIESPDFVGRVQAAAKKSYGFVFPMARTGKLEITAAAAPSRKAPSTSSKGTSSGTAALFTALKRDMSDAAMNKSEKGYEFLRDLAGMWRKGTATDADVVAAVRLIEQHVAVGKGRLAARLDEGIYSSKSYRGFEDVVLGAAGKRSN